jgi:hypothetical protein
VRAGADRNFDLVIKGVEHPNQPIDREPPIVGISDARIVGRSEPDRFRSLPHGQTPVVQRRDYAPCNDARGASDVGVRIADVSPNVATAVNQLQIVDHLSCSLSRRKR